MRLKIGEHYFEHYSNLVVNLRYNQVASSFSFTANADPNNPQHVAMFAPGKYPKVVIEEGGQVLLAGTLWPDAYNDNSEPELTPFAGYSTTGILEDSSIDASSFPVQYDGLTLKQITEKLIKPFNIKLLVDSAVAADVNKVYDTTNAGTSGTIKSFLAELCAQRGIIMTHTAKGELLYTRVATKPATVYDFTAGMDGVKFGLKYGGQQMHSEITVRRQADDMGGNAGQATVKNPYAGTRKSIRNVQQSAGKDTDTSKAARNLLGEELQNIRFTIEMQGWYMGNELVRPGLLISIDNKGLWLKGKTKLLIDAVDLTGNAEQQSAVLSCVLPEVYNDGPVTNVFVS